MKYAESDFYAGRTIFRSGGGDDDPGFGNSQRFAVAPRLHGSHLWYGPGEDPFRQEHLSEKDENEELTLEMMNAGADDRLACVARIVGDVTVEVPE